MILQTDLDNWFSYHTPTPEQIVRYQKIRDAAKKYAETILENTISSADQTAAIRKIRESVMTANQSIACETESDRRKSVREFGDYLAQKETSPLGNPVP